MWQALGQLLPIAVAAAVSSIPITATILILLSDRRDEAATPFLLGWVIGAAAFLTAATLAAQSLPRGRPRADDPTVAVLEILIGGALVLSGIVALHRYRSSGASAGRLPAWMGRVDSLRSGPAFGLGLVLNIRPKALLLMAAAGLILHSASLGLDGTTIAMAVFIVVATSTVVAPIILTLLSPDRMSPRLGEARLWVATKGPALTAFTMVVIGSLILGVGLRQL